MFDGGWAVSAQTFWVVHNREGKKDDWQRQTGGPGLDRQDSWQIAAIVYSADSVSQIVNLNTIDRYFAVIFPII